jgi:hypothetical protein
MSVYGKCLSLTFPSQLHGRQNMLDIIPALVSRPMLELQNACVIRATEAPPDVPVAGSRVMRNLISSSSPAKVLLVVQVQSKSTSKSTTASVVRSGLLLQPGEPSQERRWRQFNQDRHERNHLRRALNPPQDSRLK